MPRPVLFRLALAAAVVLIVVVVGAVTGHLGRDHTSAAEQLLNRVAQTGSVSSPDPVSSTSSTPPSTPAVAESSPSRGRLDTLFPTPAVPAPPRPVAAGATTPPAPTPASTAAPDLTAPAAVVAWESADTAVDPNPTAAGLRAAAWLTPDLLTQLRDVPPLAGPGAQWQTWAVHRAWLQVTATVSGDDHPLDTADTAVRQVIVTVTARGRDGWTGPAEVHVDAVVLAHTAAGWRLADLGPG